MVAYVRIQRQWRFCGSFCEDTENWRFFGSYVRIQRQWRFCGSFCEDTETMEIFW